MRRIGNTLMVAGAVVGGLSGVWLWIGPSAGGMPWLVGIGLIKLTFAAGLGLMGSGAVALRLANRRTERILPSGGGSSLQVKAEDSPEPRARSLEP